MLMDWVKPWCFDVAFSSQVLTGIDATVRNSILMFGAYYDDTQPSFLLRYADKDAVCNLLLITHTVMELVSTTKPH